MKLLTLMRQLGRPAAATRLPAAETEDSWMVSWVLAAGPSAVEDARLATQDRLTRWGLERYVMVTDTLVSELIGNALNRTCDKVRLTLTTEDGLLRCEVEHLDAASAPDDGAEQRLLARFACCWGTARTCEGTAVWFELPTSSHTAHAPSAAGSLTPVHV